MSTEEFWEGEPRLLDTYRIYYEQKQEIMDEEAWLNGYYVFVGVQACIYNMWRKSSDKPAQYLDKPLTLAAKQEEKEKTQREMVKVRELKIKDKLHKSKMILERKNDQGQK